MYRVINDNGLTKTPATIGSTLFLNVPADKKVTNPTSIMILLACFWLVNFLVVTPKAISAAAPKRVINHLLSTFLERVSGAFICYQVRARRESNPQPLVPKTNALSIKLRALITFAPSACDNFVTINIVLLIALHYLKLLGTTI